MKAHDRTKALRCSDERGAVAIVLATAMMGMVAVSMWGVSAATISAAKREAQRAADLSALAAAANLPLVGVLSPSEPATTACAEAARLLGDDPSPLINRLAVGQAPTCTNGGVSVSSGAAWATVTQIQNGLNSVLNTSGVLNPLLCNPLVNLLLDPLLHALSIASCNEVRDAITNLPTRLSPALITPRVTIGITTAVKPPVGLAGMGDQRTITVDAIARRRFKNVIVLPALPDNTPARLGSLNLNQTAIQVRDTFLPALQTAATAVDTLLDPVLPAGTGLNLTDIVLDIRDVYDPPVGVTPPSPLQVAQEAIRTGDPVILIRLFRMPLINIPAFDFTASYLEALPAGTFRALPIPAEQLAAARGIFGATLVN